MKPSEARFLDNLQAGAIQYIVPVYQRMYSWREDNCLQLWQDILAIGEAEEGQHFTGSIVWVQDGTVGGGGDITALLIDGQQRMTTLSLLLIALADYAKTHENKRPDGEPLKFKCRSICVNYLLFDDDIEELRPMTKRRYKLTLSDEDDETFHSLIDELLDSNTPKVRTSQRISENYEMMRAWLEGIEDPNLVWNGIKKLQIISVSLDQGKDNPQAIFESMNSTGKDLTAADLVRNYVLMGLPVKDQNRLYWNYWRPIEHCVEEGSEDEHFDNFLKSYLAVLNAPEPINLRDVYTVFKRRLIRNNWDDSEEIEQLLDEMKRYAGYYSRIAFATEQDDKLCVLFKNIANLGVTVVNALLLEFCDAADEDRNRITRDDLCDLLAITESYLLRRAVCGCFTNSLDKFFSSVIGRLRTLDDDVDYKQAFIVFLRLEDGTARRFPNDIEFETALRTRNMYSFRKVLYLLNRLENSYHEKSPLDFSTGQYSIEHIMPQNALAHDEWIEMLGGTDIAQETYAELLHTLGNLTVTAYNSELSDGTFPEKKNRIEGGFDKVRIFAISQDCAETAIWNAEVIKARADRLAKQAVGVWPEPEADPQLLVELSRKPKSFTGRDINVTLRMLVDDGYLDVGTKLFHEGEFDRINAEITPDAKIRISNGEVFNSPSSAAIRTSELRIGARHSRNGWFYWHIDDENETLLNDIRVQYRNDKGDNTELSDWDTWHISFWEGFYEIVSEMPEFCEAFGDLSERKPNKGYFCELPTDFPGMRISLQVYSSERDLGVRCGVWFNSDSSYPAFYSKKELIENIVDAQDATWFWDPVDANKKSRYPYAYKRLDVNDPEERYQAYDWFIEMAWAFKRALDMVYFSLLENVVEVDA